MKTCQLCLEPVDLVNGEGLCDECAEEMHNQEAQDLMDQEDYLNYIEEGGE